MRVLIGEDLEAELHGILPDPVVQTENARFGQRRPRLEGTGKMESVECSDGLPGKGLPAALEHRRRDPQNLPMGARLRELSSNRGGLPICQRAKLGSTNTSAVALHKEEVRYEDLFSIAQRTRHVGIACLAE